MVFYGLLDHGLDEVIEFYPSREASERELAEILADEPSWRSRLEIVAVELDGSELRIIGLTACAALDSVACY